MAASFEKLITSFIEECISSMWIGSLYKNGPTQHICMSGVHSSTYFSTKLLREVLDTTLLEITNILQNSSKFEFEVHHKSINKGECEYF